MIEKDMLVTWGPNATQALVLRVTGNQVHEGIYVHGHARIELLEDSGDGLKPGTEFDVSLERLRPVMVN